ncbi:17894_t:CDS:2, partial [Funneliformis caledonium]
CGYNEHQEIQSSPPTRCEFISSVLHASDFQNIKQLESSFYMNKKKRTADEAFKAEDYDYLYGIVSNGIRKFFYYGTGGKSGTESESEGRYKT